MDVSRYICGFCGKPGADKTPHPIRWPGEESAGTELVHADCENSECSRAHREFLERVGEDGVKDFLMSI